ncbi:MAG: rhodanese-like domain-containing protein [Candidatus Rokuibacteriota bacterium]
MDRHELRRLLERGAQLVEVLSSKSYARLHLPEAVNIPLGELARRAVTELSRERPIVVYCYDRQ